MIYICPIIEKGVNQFVLCLFVLFVPNFSKHTHGVQDRTHLHYVNDYY